MSTLPKYWILYQIGLGNCQGKERIKAKEFLIQQISGLDKGEEVPDKEIIRQLWRLYQSDNDKPLAELCLRCVISHYIKKHCYKLANKYGSKHNFTVHDLLPLVLDSGNSSLNHGNHNSLTSHILQTFDLEKSLSAWVNILVRRDKELKSFLLQYGIEEVTNWSLLKQYTPRQLQRKLKELHPYSEIEIQRFTKLLECYHTIYLTQIQTIRKELGKKTAPYPAPNRQQLQQISEELLTTWQLSADEVLQELQKLAQLIREYKTIRRARNVATQTLNESAVGASTNNCDRNQEESQLSTVYHKLLHDCLMTAIEEVTEERVNYLRSKKRKKHQQFLQGLKLFHCQNIPMEKLAELLELNNHSQVSRLLDLRSFRADISRRILVKLRPRILKLAQAYHSPEKLRGLEQEISKLLDEQISTIIQAAEREASVSKNRVMSSEFSRGVCKYLDTRKSDE